MAVPAMTNNSPTAGSIAWGAFNLRYNNVSYAISAGSTSMRWVWWRYNAGASVIEAGPDVPQNLTDDDLVLFGNKNGIGVRVQSTSLVDGELLVDGSIITRALAANTVTADRLTVGSQNASVITNGTFEDPEILVGSAINWNGFGSWSKTSIPAAIGVGAVVSENRLTPISGTRSMKLTMNAITDGQRMINAKINPVTSSQQWFFSAKVRSSRYINKRGVAGEGVFTLTAHTSNGSVPPSNAHNGTTIIWSDIAQVEEVSAGTRTQASIVVTVDSTTITGAGFKDSDVGMEISGIGIPDNSRIVAVDVATNAATISSPALASGTITITIRAVYTLSGVLVIPQTHTQMCVSIFADAADNGTGGYIADIDEVLCYPANSELVIYGPDGNPAATVDNFGNASFNDLSYRGTFDASGDTLLIDGAPIREALVTDDLQITNEPIFQDLTLTQHIKKNFKLKMAAMPGVSSTSTNSTTNNSAFLEGEVNVVAGNTYRMTYEFTVGTGVANTTWDTTVNYTENGTTPTANSTTLNQGTKRWVNPTTTATGQARTFFFTATTTGRFRFVLCNRQIAGTATSAIVYFTAAYRPVVIIDDVGESLNGVSTALAQRNKTDSSVDNTNTTPPPDNTTLTKYTKTYTAKWSSTYNQQENKIGSDGIDITQGYYSGTNGNQRALIGGFERPGGNSPEDDLTSVEADKIDKVEVYLYVNHWYNNSGGTAVVGFHGGENRPLTRNIGNDGVVPRFKTKWSKKTGGRWIDVTTESAAQWKSGTHRGIMLGPGDSTSKEFYGSFDGHKQGSPPQIRITYRK